LQNVQLEVAGGSVHALVGENGAGKSTLVKILAGLEQPDSGEIWLKGQPARLKNPHDALKLGIAMIHQELMPFPDLTVAENIFMGQEPAGGFPGWINRPRLLQDAEALLNRLGAAFPPARKMRELSVAEMQLVEIARALAHRAEVIIMDEPTSALSEREVEALFQLIRELQQQGTVIIYITHRLEEVFALADTVTVLRDGQFIATHRIAEVNRDQLIALMVGRELTSVFPKHDTPKGPVALEVCGLSKAGQFYDISFTVRRGEVVSLAGLMGAGRTEVVSAIYGLNLADAGEIRLRGAPVTITQPADAIRHGLGFVSEDRKELGLVVKLPVKHNLTLVNLRRCCRGWFISKAAENQIADEQIRALNIKTASRNQIVEHLSGGNQQKVAVARTLLADPEIIILDEPTRGIDIAAKVEVYALIARLAAQGKAILLVSSEILEILSLSDRILVLREGRIAAELEARKTTPEQIMRQAMINAEAPGRLELDNTETVG
jgi:inositol transport system ATP-binding protein